MQETGTCGDIDGTRWYCSSIEEGPSVKPRRLERCGTDCTHTQQRELGSIKRRNVISVYQSRAGLNVYTYRTCAADLQRPKAVEHRSPVRQPFEGDPVGVVEAICLRSQAINPSETTSEPYITADRLST